MNDVPLARIRGKFRFKDDRLNRLAVRRRDLEAKIKAGRSMAAFRPLIKKIHPVCENGFSELEKFLRHSGGI